MYVSKYVCIYIYIMYLLLLPMVRQRFPCEVEVAARPNLPEPVPEVRALKFGVLLRVYVFL